MLMKNGDFIVDTKSGVVVFCQLAHGKNYVSISKAHNADDFNIGVGQLIAMKRNEIKIRKVDLEGMREVSAHLGESALYYEGYGIHSKLYTNAKQVVDEKINASLNHIRELKKDLKALYDGTYDRLPEDVKSGKKVYAVVNGSMTLVDNNY